MLVIIAKSNFIKKKQQIVIIINLKNKKVIFKKPKYRYYKKIKYVKASYQNLYLELKKTKKVILIIYLKHKNSSNNNITDAI